MDPNELAKEVGAFEKERLEALAAKPNTTVYTVKHDNVHEPWKMERLRPVLSKLAARLATFEASVDDFTVRKTCLDDPDILAFQRAHPKLYWLVTDRSLMHEDRFRNALGALLTVRDRVESGQLREGQEADATATSAVMRALGTSMPGM